MKEKIKFLIVFIASSALLISIFVLINPENKPIFYVFIPVLLMWVTLYALARLILSFLVNNSTKLQKVFIFVGCSLLILLLLLSGIGQLTIRDVVLVLCLAVIGGFYFYRSWV